MCDESEERTAAEYCIKRKMIVNFPRLLFYWKLCEYECELEKKYQPSVDQANINIWQVQDRSGYLINSHRFWRLTFTR